MIVTYKATHWINQWKYGFLYENNVIKTNMKSIIFRANRTDSRRIHDASISTKTADAEHSIWYSLRQCGGTIFARSFLICIHHGSTSLVMNIMNSNLNKIWFSSFFPFRCHVVVQWVFKWADIRFGWALFFSFFFFPHYPIGDPFILFLINIHPNNNSCAIIWQCWHCCVVVVFISFYCCIIRYWNAVCVCIVHSSKVIKHQCQKQFPHNQSQSDFLKIFLFFV